jgi:hypothetical protein
VCTQEAEEELEVALEQLGQQQMAETKGLKEEFEKVRRPLRPFCRPFGLRFTYVTSVLVKKD